MQDAESAQAMPAGRCRHLTWPAIFVDPGAEVVNVEHDLCHLLFAERFYSIRGEWLSYLLSTNVYYDASSSLIA